MPDGTEAATSRINGFGWVACAYLLAIAVAFPFVDGEPGGPIGALTLAFLVSTLVIWGFSTAFGNGSFVDAYWSIAPPLVSLYWVGLASDGIAARQIVVTFLVLAWAIRLTWNWARGWEGLTHEDWRYVGVYESVPLPKWLVSLFGIHVVPISFVFAGCLSLIPAVARGGNAIGLLDVVAVIVTGGAILIETIADEQMREFARDRQSGDIMRSGLWAYSRHPNYFGEIGFWWGLFCFGLAADPSWWWTVVGPLAMTLMFHFASVPMLDQRSLERRPGYEKVVAELNAIVPGPRRG